MNLSQMWPPHKRPECLREHFLSKALNGIWLLAGLFIWISMALADINLIINVVIFSGATYLVVRILQEHVLTRQFYLRKRIKGKWVSLALSIAISTAWWYSTFISGGWNPAHKIPSSCFWFIHLHHWMWGAGIFSWLLYITFLTKKKEELRFQSRLAFFASLILFGVLIFFSVIHGLFPDDSGFWIVLIVLIFFCFSLGVILKDGDPESRWFVMFMAISFGVALGIFIQGFSFAFIELAANNPDPFTYVGETLHCK